MFQGGELWTFLLCCLHCTKLRNPQGLRGSSVFAQEIVKGRSSFLLLQGFFGFSLWPFLLQQIYFLTLSSSYSERDAIQPLRTNLFEMNALSLFPSLFSSFPLSFFFFLPLPTPSLSPFLSLCSPFLSSFIQVLWGEKQITFLWALMQISLLWCYNGNWHLYHFLFEWRYCNSYYSGY